MGARPRIPRITFPGWDALNTALESWAEAIERALRPQAVAPLKVYQGASGPVFRLDAPPAVGIGVTTTSVPSGTYSSPGKGSMTVYQMSGDSGVTTGRTVTNLYNVTEKKVASGSGVVWGFDGVNYFILVVDKCSNLS